MRISAPFERDSATGPVWIEANTAFGFDDLVYFKGKGEVSFDDIAGRIDLVLTGPHANAALPREMEPFVADGVTERMQFDFSDHTTSALGRQWAARDERVVYIEFPHHRMMFDPNRPRPADVGHDLAEFWRRFDLESPGRSVSYADVDAVRPVSFGGMPFLRRPETDTEWNQLTTTLNEVALLGATPYDQIRVGLIDQVIDAKCQHLSQVDVRAAGAGEWASAQHLHVVCIHDTMNSSISTSGAVSLSRPTESRLPSIVSLANRGDARGEPRPSEGGGRLLAADVPTIDGAGLRSARRAMQAAFDVDERDGQSSVALNHPYLGAFEVENIARQLRALEAEAVVRQHGSDGLLRIQTGAYQAEFLRELLLGSANVDVVRAPGDHWPDSDVAHIAVLVDRLVHAYDLLRQRNFGIRSSRPTT